MTNDESTPTVSRRTFIAGAAALGVGGVATASATNTTKSKRFTVRLTNVSDGETLQTTADGDGAMQPVPLSPGAFAVHTPDEPFFSAGSPARMNGLTHLAEDGMPGALAQAAKQRASVLTAGAFTTPMGANGPGPLLPGHSYEFSFDASSGRPELRLSMVTMFVPSNDAFYSLGGADGVNLFDGEAPLAGNQTDMVDLWDAGTEINQEPGVGGNQPQRQRAANTGDVEREPVVPISSFPGYDYPDVRDVLSVKVMPTSSN